MSSKIDNIYMYMPIILKSLSLYAISSQPLWFTAGDIICLCVAFSVFNQAVNLCSYQPPPPIYIHRHTCIQPSPVPLHTLVTHTCIQHLHSKP